MHEFMVMKEGKGKTKEELAGDRSWRLERTNSDVEGYTLDAAKDRDRWRKCVARCEVLHEGGL